MEFKKEQQLLQQVINRAWEDPAFKEELINAPLEAIEKLTGEKVQLPEGKTLVVKDQTDDAVVYINIPVEPNLDNLELNEEQLEAVAGGAFPFPWLPPIIPILWGGAGDAQA